jgi:imidazolonepropionase-like amidohydrolase
LSFGGACALGSLAGEADAQPRAPKPKPGAKAAAPPQKPRPTASDGESWALVGASLLRPDALPLEGSVIVVRGERVAYVGSDAAQAHGARVVPAQGRVVTAGLCDLLTQIGLAEVLLEPSTRHDQHESKDPVRAAFQAADGYDPASSLVAVTRIAGITSVGVVPAGGLVAGQSAWIDLDGDVPERAIARPSLALHVVVDDAALGGTETSFGTVLLRLRELFDDTRAYRQKRDAYERRQLRELGASRLDYEAMARALDGKLPVVFHVDRASDILGTLALAKAHGLRAVLASAAEAWKVRRALAEARVPVVLYPFDDKPRSFAALGARADNAALLHAAGVTIALSVGSSHNARKLRQVAGNAVRAGLSLSAALDAVTAAPARIVGMDADYGTPNVGRIANLVVWTGHPFELSTRAESVVIRGRAVPLRSRQTALFERYR